MTYFDYELTLDIKCVNKEAVMKITATAPTDEQAQAVFDILAREISPDAECLGLDIVEVDGITKVEGAFKTFAK